MNTEVKKKMTTCTIVWAVFVAIKWIMIFSQSSALYKMGPASIIIKDATYNYSKSGWISLIIETVFLAAFFFIRTKKISILYILCTLYTFMYIPAIIYCMQKEEYDWWRYLSFMPAVVCCVMLVSYFRDYAKMPSIKKPNKTVAVTEDDESSKTQDTKEIEEEKTQDNEKQEQE